MDTIFMNSENSKTSMPHVLILKIYEEVQKALLYQILVFTILGKK